jgi:RNA polymerase sigma-70 factor (ECF subfamily)
MEERLVDLVGRVVEHDEEALRLLHLHLSGEVFAIAYVRLHDPDAAEDVRQETFLRIWTKAGSFLVDRATDATARAWVLSIARNLATDRLRLQTRETPCEGLVGRREPSRILDVDNLCARLDLSALLGTLPPKLREPVALRVLAGYSCGECALQLGVSVPTVKRRVRAGLSALRGCIEPGGSHSAASTAEEGDRR